MLLVAKKGRHSVDIIWRRATRSILPIRNGRQKLSGRTLIYVEVVVDI